MKLFKKCVSLILIAALIFTLSACGEKQEPVEPAIEPVPVEPETDRNDEHVSPDVTIIFTNDTHTYINNQAKTEDGETVDLLNFAKVAALKNELIENGETVFLVDAGDHAFGTAYGGFDEGAGVINIMETVGYDVSAIGNHEFSFGMFRALDIFSNTAFPHIACNFIDTVTGEKVLDGSVIIERNGVRIAFIGISTPEIPATTATAYFQDSKGDYIYSFLGGDDPSALYSAVQDEIDAVKGRADYVIALGHCGSEDWIDNYCSTDIIANTTGLTAFIDGHSHSPIACESVSDKDGKPVILTRAENYFGSIGVMHISGGEVTSELISEYDSEDTATLSVMSELIGTVEAELGSAVAILDSPIYTNSPENPEVRIVRDHNTNSSDLCADAIYWYFNDYMSMPCDVTLINSGGIRSDIAAGDFTYLSAKQLHPYGNVLCLVEIDGATLMDVLELGAIAAPGENGSLIKAGGLRYTIDTSVEPTIQYDSDYNYVGSPTGEYRVKNVEIYNRDTGEYEPIDLGRTYTVGGQSYILRNGGSGMAMLMSSDTVINAVTEDYLVLAEYAAAFAVGEDGIPHINNASAPVAAYAGYLYDYENPYGSERLLIAIE